MKKIIKKTIYRLLNNTRYRKNFILSFFLTYVITVGMAFVVALLGVDASGGATTLKFHQSELTVGMYVWAILIEASMPTTITFCGVSLLFQMSPRSIGTSGTFIITSILLLSVLYITMAQIANSNIMFGLLIAALLLDLIPIAISCACYIEPNVLDDRHKQEESDGSVSGSIN